MGAKHIDKFCRTELLQAIGEHCLKLHGNWFSGQTFAHNELTLTVRRAHVVEAMRFLKDDRKCQFRQLLDVTAVDWLSREGEKGERFEVVYHLISLVHNLRVRVKVPVADGVAVPSITPVFAAANWYERETFDMFGISFDGHPDLRRILSDYGFEGHPLRKDFPLNGHLEVYYDEKLGRVAHKPVELPQETRHFDKVSKWAGLNSPFTLSDGADNGFSMDEFKEGK